MSMEFGIKSRVFGQDASHWLGESLIVVDLLVFDSVSQPVCCDSYTQVDAYERRAGLMFELMFHSQKDRPKSMVKILLARAQDREKDP